MTHWQAYASGDGQPPKLERWAIPSPLFLCVVVGRIAAFAPDNAGWSSVRNPYSGSSKRRESFERGDYPCRQSARSAIGRQVPDDCVPCLVPIKSDLLAKPF